MNEKQYSCQVEDGSIFRFYYVFDRRGREIQSASLAYYAAIASTLHQEEKGIIVYQNEDEPKNDKEESAENMAVSSLRFDAFALPYYERFLKKDCIAIFES